MKALILTHQGVRYRIPTDDVLAIVAAVKANPGYLRLLGCEKCKTVCGTYYPMTICACCEERRLNRSAFALNPHPAIVDTETFVARAEESLAA